MVRFAATRRPTVANHSTFRQRYYGSNDPYHHQQVGRARGFCSRDSFIMLFTGVMIGYLILPIVLVERLGFDHVMQRMEQREGNDYLHMSLPAEKNGFDGKNADIIHEKTSVIGSLTEAHDNQKDLDVTTMNRRSTRTKYPSKKQEDDAQKTMLRTAIESDEEETKQDQILSEAQKRFLEDQKLLASQSIPTATTPYVMTTPQLPDSKRKKILVTGGAGFVGSHLVDKLMTLGHEVIVVDNFFTGQKRNIGHWLHHPNFSLVVHDVTEPIMLEVDQIYHLACPASPPHYQYNPVKTIKTSTMGTINMLGLAKRVKARILLTSTSEIYGDPKEHPQKETYWGNVNTVGPRSCYDEGKRVAETMMYSYKNQNDVQVRVARIFNTFGPRMHPNDGRVVSNFIIQALQEKPISIYGNGSQTRSFQYVSDLVEGLYALMNGDYDLPVNLGNPDEYSVKDFAEYIKDLTNSKSKITYLDASQDDPSRRKPDISLAKEVIGWEPKVQVKDGLKETISYFDRVLKESGEIIPTGPGAAKPKKDGLNSE